MSEMMIDLRLSLLAGLQSLPIWVLRRPEGWLKDLRGDGLWEQFIADGLTRYARCCDFAFSIYRAIALHAVQQTGVSIGELGLAPDLKDGIETGRLLPKWREAKFFVRSFGSHQPFLFGSN